MSIKTGRQSESVVMFSRSEKFFVVRKRRPASGSSGFRFGHCNCVRARGNQVARTVMRKEEKEAEQEGQQKQKEHFITS